MDNYHSDLEIGIGDVEEGMCCTITAIRRSCKGIDSIDSTHFGNEQCHL